MKRITIIKAFILISILLISGLFHLSHAQNQGDIGVLNPKGTDYGEATPLLVKSTQDLTGRVEML